MAQQPQFRAREHSYLVLSLKLNHSGQVDERAFHAVQSLDDDHDLLPRSVSPGLALAYDFPQEVLQVLHVVVLESPDDSAAQPHTDTDRRVIEFVGNDEAAFASQSRDGGRVGSVSHRRDQSVFLADELSDELLSLDVQIRGTAFQPGLASRQTVLPDTLLDGISASTASLSETEVVVRRDVEGAGAVAGGNKSVVVVLGDPIEGDDGAAGDSSDGAGEDVFQTVFEAAGVERVEVRGERGIALKERRG